MPSLAVRAWGGSGAVAVLVSLLLAQGVHARNAILMIGDGMGPEQIKAGGIFENGAAGSLGFESLPHHATVTTASADSSVTDSAAAATAMATGFKVANGVISVAIPGGGGELATLLERAKAEGLVVGLVTTTYMTHATPAAFGAHEPSRNNTAQIAADYLGQTMPNVLLGGGANGMGVTAAENAGYTVVTDYAGLMALDTSTVSMVSGQFGASHMPYAYDGLGALPHLADMVAVALDVLDDDPDGFFLLVEGGRIDHACHDNDITRAVWEIREFDNAFDVAMAWASGRDDTTIMVTADHETGGLTITGNNGAGNDPTVTWSTTGHTAADVDIYVWGLGADGVAGSLDNTDVCGVVASALALPPPPPPSPIPPVSSDSDGCSPDGHGDGLPLLVFLGVLVSCAARRKRSATLSRNLP